jgi:hypothetical protein
MKEKIKYKRYHSPANLYARRRSHKIDFITRNKNISSKRENENLIDKDVY